MPGKKTVWESEKGGVMEGGAMGEVYVNAELLMIRMYTEAFEKDSDLQKWDGGCWIRYKLFEQVMSDMPKEDVIKPVRCKDCVYAEFGEDFDDVCCNRMLGGAVVSKDWYCAAGERYDGAY